MYGLLVWQVPLTSGDNNNHTVTTPQHDSHEKGQGSESEVKFDLVCMLTSRMLSVVLMTSSGKNVIQKSVFLFIEDYAIQR